jgi:hypothetical protein
MSFAKLFALAVLLMGGVLGVKFIASWYDDLQLKGAMQEFVKEAPLSTDAAVISAVLAKAQQLKVPLDPRDIHLERSPQGSMRLWAEYDVTVTFPLGFSHTQGFRPEVWSSRR